MMELKYIVVKDKDFGTPGIVVFSPWLKHKDVAGDFEVLSAGMVSGGKQPSVFGKSTTLGKSPNHDDDNMLLRQLLQYLLGENE